MVIAKDWLDTTTWMRWSLQEIRRVLDDDGVAIMEIRLCNRPNFYTGFFGKLITRGVGATRKILRSLGLRKAANFLVTINTPCKTRADLAESLETIDFESEIISMGATSPTVFLRSCLGIGSSQSFGVSSTAVDFVPANRNSANERWVRTVINEQFKTELADLADWRTCCGESTHSPIFLQADALPRRALILSPHPDDELIGAGGTMMKIIASGGSVQILHMTNGKQAHVLSNVTEPTRSTIRLREAACVASNLQAGIECWEKNGDGNLSATKENVERLRQLMHAFQPDAVFLPFINDAHPDHVASNYIFQEAYQTAHSPNIKFVYAYEIWSMCPCNVAVDITHAMSRKRSLLSFYRTAIRPVDYAWRNEIVSAFHMHNIGGRRGYAEVFVQHVPHDYCNLVTNTLPC
jgi:LmbE family N-acetylglucosaminyl deacetylase